MELAQLNELSNLSSLRDGYLEGCGNNFDNALHSLGEKIGSEGYSELPQQVQSFINNADNITPDGSIDAEELAAALDTTSKNAEELVSALDTNGDNAVSAEEITQLLEGLLQAGSSGASGPGEGAGGTEKAKAPGGGEGSCGCDGAGSGGLNSLYDLLVELLDKNGDGKIDAKELEALDKNGDGKITKQEFSEGIEELADEQGVELPGDEELAAMIDEAFGISPQDLAGSLALDQVGEKAAA